MHFLVLITAEFMLKNKTLLFIFIFIAVIGLWSYFAGLPIDVTRDAGKYATVAKEMFQIGDLIHLTIHGDAYDQKPPMMFWLGALGFLIGGISNFWFKLPMLLLVFAGFYWAYQLGKSLYNKRVGYLTATFLAFSVIYSLYSMDIHADTPLQAFITLALWQLFEFIKTRKNKHWILGFTAIGLAMLSKGPIGAAIPAFAVVGHILLKKEYRFLFDYRWYLGTVLAFVVASPALIGLMNQFGWEGIRFFFWENNVGRITGSYVKSVNDPIFYIHTLLYVFLPWVLLFFIAAFNEFKMLVKNRFRANEYFTFTGIWIFYLIISASKNQVPNYIFSIIPLMAVLTAKWADNALERQTGLTRIFNGVQNFAVVLIWVMIAALNFYLFPLPGMYFWLVVVIAISATFFVYKNLTDPELRLILPTILAFSALMFLLNTHVFPYIFSYQAPPKAARYFNENASETEKLYNYKYGQYELFFYSEPQATQLKTEAEMKKAAEAKGSWIFTDHEGIKDFEALQLKTDTIIEYKHLYLNKGGRFINPKTRDKVLQPMYLIKLPN
jgi:4-amino-4-deoxy-L-arabinose transferase-like glycosyltransferase